MAEHVRPVERVIGALGDGLAEAADDGADRAIAERLPHLAAIADAVGAGAAEGTPSLRTQVGEPVIRHVAEALCALESSGEPGADGYLLTGAMGMR